MYKGKISLNMIPAKPNLIPDKTALLTKFNINNIIRECFKFLEKGKSVRNGLLSVPETLKSQSINIMRSWTHQCECVLAQRLRRGQQMFFLYTRLWEEHALRDFMKKMRQQVTKRGTEFVFGAMGITAYNWDQNRISDDEIKQHTNELDYIRKLRGKTLTCQTCSNKAVLPCSCPSNKKTYNSYDDWTVFIEKNDMIVWRRLRPSGSYEYKVYGSFNDVCADDFLNVQIDIDYRKQWDTTAVSLDVIERDPNPKNNSDIIYWEMYWPKLFANRDYVFKRRYLIDTDSKILLLVSKCTEHPKRPITVEKYRVSDYNSHMIIRPHKDFFSPGIEFALTYYDNPGVNIPAAVTAWVAYRAMPEFLTKLRVAARDYQKYCDEKLISRRCDLKQIVEEEIVAKESYLKSLKSASSQVVLLKDKKKIEEKQTLEMGIQIQERIPGVDIMTSPTPIVQAEVSKHNYWKYLQPTYYFS
ncbi:stAR-related lipid transfer protein 7, mitochondrial [Onthophagus taurus]|uniref:stAR-related lipid transfer protein 7, mitochondrial n=1 Tax=Onthophagus taurus TaxID=166361 RepID=UPI000C2046D2|nr:stAR-related lipid transfer protein 7, mitochondrial [Onthophagus taurus]